MPLKSSRTTTANPFLLDDLMPLAQRHRPVRLVKWVFESLLGLRYLAREYRRLPQTHSPVEFVQQSFKVLGIGHEVDAAQLENIPRSGAVLIVANHPFGGLEGMLMVELLMQRRTDVRIMANSMLNRIPELEHLFIGVNPYEQRRAKQQNLKPLRDSLRWLQQGGLLCVFPAGDVAGFSLRSLSIREGQWDDSIARLARKSGASVIPVHIAGRNSAGFYLAALLHPVLKTLLLPRQLFNKRGQHLRMSIGKPLPMPDAEASMSATELAAYMRMCCLVLRGKQKQPAAPGNPPQTQRRQSPIMAPVEKHRLVQDLAGLEPSQLLASAGKLQVWYARAEQIPSLLPEIGRLREVSFRAVGEGTGNSTDLDRYDRIYLHLFVWDAAAAEVAGAYRLGLVQEIRAQHGINALYSHSLFRYGKLFLDRMGTAIELGRSFVSPQYQRSFTPLLLLWKGIGQFVRQHPACAVLFGPVSISSDYDRMSQRMMVSFLKHNLYDPGLGQLVRPRRPYRLGGSAGKLGTLPGMGLEELSELIARIEPDDKGVPVLLRQYLKLGGKMLGFNVDPAFNNCVDGLIRVDLRQADPRLLARYMGQDGAEEFLAWHQPLLLKAG